MGGPWTTKMTPMNGTSRKAPRLGSVVSCIGQGRGAAGALRSDSGRGHHHFGRAGGNLRRSTGARSRSAVVPGRIAFLYDRGDARRPPGSVQLSRGFRLRTQEARLRDPHLEASSFDLLRGSVAKSGSCGALPMKPDEKRYTLMELAAMLDGVISLGRAPVGRRSSSLDWRSVSIRCHRRKDCLPL